jgi:hypothetical protein
VSLTAEKPNDCHTVLAEAITELLAPRRTEGLGIPRSTAKNVKYGCSYNAQVAARLQRLLGVRWKKLRSSSTPFGSKQLR